MNSNQDGCDALLAAAVLAGPNSKHAIISLLTTADGHKVLESPSKACSDYKPNPWLRACVCVFVILQQSSASWNMCHSLKGSTLLKAKIFANLHLATMYVRCRLC